MKLSIPILCLTFALPLAVLPGCQEKTEPQARKSTPPADLPGLKAKAEAGDGVAAALLGRLYMNGEGAPLNYKEAAKWLRMGADKNVPDAEAALGELHEAGQGVEQDIAQALKYYRAAADHGSAKAQYNLGFMYESGRNVQKDHSEAAKWFKMAAEQGEPLAQFDLGQRYDLGLGVSVDRVEAVKWLTLAAKSGQKDAAERVSAVKEKMTKSEVSEALRRAEAFTRKSPLLK